MFALIRQLFSRFSLLAGPMIQHSMSHIAFTVPYTEEDVQHEYVTGEATDVYPWGGGVQ